jgi:hypothetical protein
MIGNDQGTTRVLDFGGSSRASPAGVKASISMIGNDQGTTGVLDFGGSSRA